MASKSFSATTDQISGNYPKAPGYERGPLSPNRGNESSMGRLRTHSLNMAHLDLGRRCNVSSFDAAPGTSLPSHSSLCRSDSGFHAVTGDWSLFSVVGILYYNYHCNFSHKLFKLPVGSSG
ncbi:unnamed protein product [Haemonchus placei]|uniref:CKK domain-containing protein n=1 Tax=Haemonchus placei TaxID=6290 RepID=A0A0N4WJP0_HAEPC|nr:unnamed protein product [Haemonchus placei]